MDYHWFKADAQQLVIAERYLTFFKNQGSGYKNHYDWNGSNAGGDHSTGLVACNAVAALTTTNTSLSTPFVQEFWNIAVPSGQYRYYDGMLYVLGLLNVSGNFKVWKADCPNSCTTPAPTVTATVSYEQGENASALTATGTALKWYTDATGGTGSTTAPVPNTATKGTTTYYVAQTLNSCEGPRASITVTISNTYKFFQVVTAPTIDGIVDEVWNTTNVLSLNATKAITGTVSNTNDLSGYAKVLWDASYVYVLAVITDDNKQNDSQNSYDDDAVEFYFDINNDKATTYGDNDVQYSFGWNDGSVVGALPSTRSTNGITYNNVSTTNGYIIEARIPWTTLLGTPVIGQKLGIDFMINDDDDGTARDGKLSWNSATDNAWQDASIWGTAILADAVVTGLEDLELAAIDVYPNPTHDLARIRGLSGGFSYLVVDNTGRLLCVGKSIDGSIAIDRLDTGVYVLIIQSQQGQKIVKVVKE